MPLVRYEIRSEYELANRDLYRTAPKNDPEAILEGVAMVSLVGIVRQLGDLAEFAADVFHDLHEAVMATASRSHDLILRVSQLEGELPSVEKALYSKKTNHLQFAYAAGTDWHASIRNDQNHCTQGDLPRFIRSSYEECRGPPMLFMLDKFDIQGAGACLKRYTDPSFFRTEWASSELLKAEKAQQQQKKSRRGKKKARNRKDGIPDTKPAVQFQPRVRYSSLSLSSIDGMSENTAPLSTMVVENEQLGKAAQLSNFLEASSHQSSRESTVSLAKSPKRFGFGLGKPVRFNIKEPEPQMKQTEEETPIANENAGHPEAGEGQRDSIEERPRDSIEGATSEMEQFLDAMTTMESETDSEPRERRKFYVGKPGFMASEAEFQKARNEYDKDVFYEDARNSTMESETESKFSAELTPIEAESTVHEDAVDSSSQRELRQFEGSSSPELEDIPKDVETVEEIQTFAVSRDLDLELDEAQTFVVSKDLPRQANNESDEEIREVELKPEVFGEQATQHMDEQEVVPESDLEDEDLPVQTRPMEVKQDEEVLAEDDADEDDVQFDVEVLQVINTAQTADQLDIEHDQQQIENDLKLEAEQEAEDEVEAQVDSRQADSHFEAREGDGHLEARDVDSHFEARGHLEARDVDSHLEARDVDSHLEARDVDSHFEARDVDSHFEARETEADDHTQLPAADSEFVDLEADDNNGKRGGSLHLSEKSGEETYYYLALENSPSDTSKASDEGNTPIPWNDSEESKLRDPVRTTSADDYESASSEDVFMDPEYQSSSRLSDAGLSDDYGAEDQVESIAREVYARTPGVEWPPASPIPEVESRAVAKQEEEKTTVEQHEELPHSNSEARDMSPPDSPVTPKSAIKLSTGNEEVGLNKGATMSPSSSSPPLPFCPRVDDEEAMSLKVGVLSPLSLKSSSSYPNSAVSSNGSSPKSLIFSALQAPMSPVQAGKDDGFGTLLTPGSPTSTFDSTSNSPTLEELPPLPPLPPLRWRTSFSPGEPLAASEFLLMRKRERDITPPELPIPELSERGITPTELRFPFPEESERVNTPQELPTPSSEVCERVITPPELPIPSSEVLDREMPDVFLKPVQEHPKLVQEQVVMDAAIQGELTGMHAPEVETINPEGEKALQVSNPEEPVSPAAVMEFPDEHMDSEQRVFPTTMLKATETGSSDVPEAEQCMGDVITVQEGDPQTSPGVEEQTITEQASWEQDAPERAVDLSDAPFSAIDAHDVSVPDIGSPTSDMDMQEVVLPLSDVGFPAWTMQEWQLETSDATTPSPEPELDLPKATLQPSDTMVAPSEVEPLMPQPNALDAEPGELEIMQKPIAHEAEQVSHTVREFDAKPDEVEIMPKFTALEQLSEQKDDTTLESSSPRDEVPLSDAIEAEQACEPGLQAKQEEADPFLEMAKPETQISIPTSVKPELSLYPDARLLAPTLAKPKRDVTGAAAKLPKPKAPKLEAETLPVSTMASIKDPGDDALIQAISLHDRSKLKKVASDLRPPKAPDERNVLLEQIRSQSFNLRHTVTEKKEKKETQPRIMTNINVAAILEKANAIRQAFVGSDDEDDDDWSDD